MIPDPGKSQKIIQESLFLKNVQNFNKNKNK